MIRNYIKTAARNVARNKLFSVINIIGLAIGMSVGLLLIAFIHDVLSYDRFHINGNRIYRVTSRAKFKDGHAEKFASTSMKAAKAIKEKIAGIDESTIINTEFAGDAQVENNVVPLTGFYAEPSIFRLFTLPILKGDPARALESPFSIVLTETSAKKLFGREEPLGETIYFDSVSYQVTGVIKDVPFFSHLKFECLVSFSTLEMIHEIDPALLKWDRVWERNSFYMMVAENSDRGDVQSQIDRLCEQQNRVDDEAEVQFGLQPLYNIVLGERLSNSIGPVMPEIVLWIIALLALVVILSACFNYANLSIARAMRRFKEVGLRKVIGAGKWQVRLQFVTEAVLISLIALCLSFLLFMLLRPQFVSIAPEVLKMVKLELTIPMALFFVAFAVSVGMFAGFLPAVFFANVTIIQALKDMSSTKIFRGISFRTALVVLQYTVTLIFITSTVIGFVQYKDILAFDLGFETENVLNISLQKNKPDELINRLKSLPEVSGVSQSRLLTSVGNAWGGFLKYKNTSDSALVFTNIVDENYLPLHGYRLMAGQNFITRPVTKDATSELIVNEETLRQFDIGEGDPKKAIGEEVLLNNKRLTIIGVIQDFHYAKLDEKILPVVFTYLTPDAFLTRDARDGLVNVKVNGSDPRGIMTKVEEIWKTFDPIHPIRAEFYDDSIKEAYSELSAMIKVIGFLSFIAISIASMGLLGMVVYTTETRLKEISIRKVLGASSADLVLLLSRGFLVLLAVAAVVALPVTYVFFETTVLIKFPFHHPIGPIDLFAGLTAVIAIAVVMIGTQTVKAAQSNPADILKSE